MHIVQFVDRLFLPRAKIYRNLELDIISYILNMFSLLSHCYITPLSVKVISI